MCVCVCVCVCVTLAGPVQFVGRSVILRSISYHINNHANASKRRVRRYKEGGRGGVRVTIVIVAKIN